MTADDFDELYRAHYGNVVALAYALTGDLSEAQDLAQEAFCRAWQRWRRIAGYDDPLAWVRRVVANLASSRWRRLAVARRHLRRERADPVPELGPEHVALVAALRTLPADQRRAVVLHHLVDLPVAEVTRELGVPEGTVKSWLHRGRAALADRLAEPAAAGRRPETRAPEARAPETSAPETSAPEAGAPETRAPETEVTSRD